MNKFISHCGEELNISRHVFAMDEFRFQQPSIVLSHDVLCEIANFSQLIPRLSVVFRRGKCGNMRAKLIDIREATNVYDFKINRTWRQNLFAELTT